MALYEHFPYTNFHEMNLDWIIEETKNVIAEWAETKAEWQAFRDGIEARQDEFENKFVELKQFVLDYFNNVDWEGMLNDLMTEWKNDGTLISIIAPYLPFVTPQMFGANSEDDAQTAIQSAINAAVNNKIPCLFVGEGYVSSDTVTIPGKIRLYGNNVPVRFTAEKDGFKMIAGCGESVIQDLKITSDAERYPEDEHAALTLSGEHMLIRGVDIENFGIGVFYDATVMGSVNQTGTHLESIQARYCGIYGLYVKDNNYENRSTDFYISNCVFCGKNTCMKLETASGLQMSNIHTWCDGGSDVGIDIHNFNRANASNVYIEPTHGYNFKLHSLVGGNISDIYYSYDENIITDVSEWSLTYVEGPYQTRTPVINFTNVGIGSTDRESEFVPVLFRIPSNNISVNLTNVFNANKNTPWNGYKLKYSQTGNVYCWNAARVDRGRYTAAVEGRKFPIGIENAISYDMADVVSTVDLSEVETSRGGLILVHVIHRSNDNIITGGEVIVPFTIATAGGVRSYYIGSAEAVKACDKISVSASLSGSVVTITGTKVLTGNGTLVTQVLQGTMAD